MIKSEYAAEKINEHFTYTGHADSFLPHDARTWKYYLNIPVVSNYSTDAPIKITSLDTLEEIVFNKTNLSVHSNSASVSYNSRYYRELLVKYPDNELLILGILYPADLNQAIAAKDSSIVLPKALGRRQWVESHW